MTYGLYPTVTCQYNYDSLLKSYMSKKELILFNKRRIEKISNFLNINQKKIRESLKELLIDSTQKRLVSDVKIATSLSGGLDSSIIFSILNNLKKKNEKSFSSKTRSILICSQGK